MLKNLRRTYAAALFGTAACAACLSASPVLAQSNPFGDDTEQVIVSAPRTPAATRGARLGGEVVDVSISRTVRVDDLNLGTSDGMDALRSRVSMTASQLCNRLDRLYPVTTDDSPPCFRQAVRQAMASAGGTY